MHGHIEELSLPGLHMLGTRRSETRETTWAGLLWACRTCFPLCKARKCQRKIGGADFIPSLSKLIYYVTLSNNINLFNSSLKCIVGIMPK